MTRIAFWKPLLRVEHLRDSSNSQYHGFLSLKAFLLAKVPEAEIDIVSTKEALAWVKPDLIGISGVSNTWGVVSDAVQWLRDEGFSGPIVLGGPHVTAAPETLMDGADCAVIGPGEETFAELVAAYEKSRKPDLLSIPGLAFKAPDGSITRTGKRDLIGLEEIPVDLLHRPDAVFQISSIRGCPFHCQHCVEHDTQGKLRYINADRLFWIMKNRLKLTGNPDFSFIDDTFLPPRGRLKALHELIVRHDMVGKFRIHLVQINANLVKDYTMPMLKDIGAVNLGMGCESFNPRVLSEIKSGKVTSGHLDYSIRCAQEAGLPIGGSQVYGFPGETRAEMIDSIERVREYERTTDFRHWTCFVCTPFPGSLLWPRALEMGLVSLDMDFSRLRIDGSYVEFSTPWVYMNEEQVSRTEFLEILRSHGMLEPGFFVPQEEQSISRASLWSPFKRFVRSGLRRTGFEFRRLPR